MSPGIKFFVDRIEGDRAVVIHGDDEFSLPLRLLPGDTREGDHLVFSIDIDEAGRSGTAAKVSDLQKRLQDPGKRG